MLPVVTVAACMPVFMYEAQSSCFGVLHSAQKGTGIVLEALHTAEKKYGVRTDNIRFILSPCIGRCCYTVDRQRARFFEKEFSADCVSVEGQSEKLYRLQLEKANLSFVEKCGK